MKINNSQLWKLVVGFSLVSISLDPALILIYLFILIFTAYYSKQFEKNILLFVIGIVYLYPNTANSITHYLNSKQALLALTSIFVFINYRPMKSFGPILGKTFNIAIKSWLIWGSFAYAILLIAYFTNLIGNINLFEFMGLPPPRTSYFQMFFFTIPAALIVYIPIVSINRSESFIYLFRIFVILLGINAIYSTINYNYDFIIISSSYVDAFSSFKRAYSFSNVDPISYGTLLLYPTILVISAQISGVQKKGYLLLFVSFYVLIITWSRTVWIGFAAGLIILLLINLKIKKVIYFLPIIALFGLILYLSNPMDTILSDGRLSNPQVSWEGRAYKHNIAYGFIKNNPIFGAFPGQMITLSKTIGENEINSSAHNLYFQTAVDYGIPGLLILIFVIIYSFSLGVSILKRFNRLLTIPKYNYTRILVLASTCYVVILAISGIAESVQPLHVFFNLGILLAAKKTLILEETGLNNQNC